MMALGPHSRAALGAASLASFAAAFGLMPLGARGAGTSPRFTVALAPARTPPAHSVTVVPLRDPFAGGEPSQAPSDLATAAPVPALPAALPPNLGARDGALAVPVPPLHARVTAIATGTHPSALVDDAGKVRLVGLGDRIGDATVASIDADGVHLSDGTTLALGTAR